jgi:hypothetical protein
MGTRALGDGAADIVEVDVDAVRARVLQRRPHVVALVVDAGVVSVQLLQVRHLLGRAGDPDHPAAPGDPRELADDLADGTGRGRDDDRVTRLRLPHVEEAEVRREPGAAEHVQRRLDGRHRRVDLAERAAAGDGVLLPAELADDGVAGSEPRVVALDDLAHHLARHRLAELGGLRVRPRRAHPPAHVRIDGEPLRVHEHLAGPGRRDLGLDEREVGVLGEPFGARRQHDLPVHAPSLSHRQRENGADGARTRDLLAASQTLSQLSYGPSSRDCSYAVAASSSTAGTSPQSSSSR